VGGLTERSNAKAKVGEHLYLLPLLGPFGWLSWGTFFYMGARAQRPRWLLWGGLYLAWTIAAVILLGLNGSGDDETGSEFFDGVGTIASFVLWGVAVVHALTVRREFLHRVRLRGMTQTHEIEERVAKEIAERNPAMARRIGIGRPDRAHAEHAGLVDVNSAPVATLARLPGLDDALARQAAEIRPLGSLEEMGAVLDLPGPVVEDLRERTIFIAR
jgi:Helix-hairpin-helix motif